jgi:hypothetical protein
VKRIISALFLVFCALFFVGGVEGVTYPNPAGYVNDFGGIYSATFKTELENNLIVPMIMSKVIGLQPPIIIISLLIGAEIAGIGGAFLAPPVLIILKILFNEFLTEDEKLEDSLKEQ